MPQIAGRYRDRSGRQSKRKPHNQNIGYVAERKHSFGGHIVVYDRQAGFDCDADTRWVVMHEPSSIHFAVRTKKIALEDMKNPEPEMLGQIREYYHARLVERKRNEGDHMP